MSVEVKEVLRRKLLLCNPCKLGRMKMMMIYKVPFAFV
jgi:hypothetical protein